jgi:urease accessory protein
MLGGDRLEIHIELGPDAQVCLTTASATKVHSSTEAPAEQVLSIDLGPRSCLEFLPEPTILFRGARWRQQTVIRRAADSRLLWLEPWSAGRVAQQEVFQFACLDTRLEVWTEGRLSLFDRMRICPPTYPAQALGLWEGRPHLLTLYLLQNSHPGSAWMQAIRNQLSDGPVLVGLSHLATPGMTARVLSGESEALTRVAQTLWQHIRESLWAEVWHPWRKL